MNPRKLFVFQPFCGLKSNSLFETLVILVFFCLSFVGILHHEMWRDEFQAWLLARDSSSVIELYQNLRYEGHPGLWHLCLYWISQWTHNPLAMQIFHILIATGSVCLLVKFSPFSLIERALLAFGYLFFYEYSIISRNYGIGILLIFMFCTLFPQRKNRYLLISTILALLANTNIFAFIISIALALTLLLDLAMSNDLFSTKRRRRLAIGFLIVLAGWGASIVQIARPLENLTIIRPVSSMQRDTIWEESLFQEIKRLAGVLAYITKSHIPIPNIDRQDFWSTSIFNNRNIFPDVAGYSSGALLTYTLSVAIVIAVAIALRHKPTVLFTYCFGTFSIILFCYFVHGGEIRHYGHLFIVLIACLWLAPFVRTFPTNLQRQKHLNILGHRLFTVMLALQVVAGVYMYSVDLKSPFSTSKETANFIKERGYQNLPIVGATSRKASTLSGYLDRQIYYLTNHEYGSFWQDLKGEEQGTEAVLEAAHSLVNEESPEVLLVLTYELKSNSIVTSELRVEQLAQFRGSIGNEEDFNIYLAQRHSQ